VDSAALPQVARLALGFRSSFLGQSLWSSVGYNEKMAHPERGETITHSVQILKEPLANDHVQSVPVFLDASATQPVTLPVPPSLLLPFLDQVSPPFPSSSLTCQRSVGSTFS
jgi:hypothetical protein